MITIKNQEQIQKMKIAGQVLAKGLNLLKSMIKPGVNCLDLDKAFEEFIKQNGCESNFKNYQGFPKTICISINDQLIHGIPKNRILQNGDIVSIDAGCMYQKWHADSAFTMVCGIANDKKNDILIRVTEKALDLAIAELKPGIRVGTIGSIIQNYVELHNFSVPRDYTGHGIGLALHEDPYIPNYGIPNTGVRLQENMVICIEPMVQMGTYKTKLADDNWTVYSADHSMTAHFEHTILITKDGCEVLTKEER
ncbi:type I methionyl aminopeptidase [Mycoplasma mycoides subsp. capri]|uniref:type I methionyl aminopeptidase n=1 Tax=Mycoplasma mycoides TaxID=2102 RepID=UPI002240C434|nr:type I methionyl aminopeptidase [Mycoplasma mycoides]UZK64513.1 type I methionyl aminopeptidase [Mycoplasma mycoides subsp. capri]